MIEINGRHLCESCFCEMTEGAFCTNCGYNPNMTAGDPTMLKPGSVLLGKYVVGKVIGKGGFGVTYVAYDVTTQKKVAIKEYFPYGVALRAPGTTTVSVSSMDNAEAFRMGAEKFYNEAKMVSRFNGNPNIVGVHEFFYENDTVYFAMEYLQGHTLKDHIKTHGVLSPAQALFIMNNVSNALMAAHSSNVLHRDISPDNIILCDNGNVTLIDFGAARQVVAEHSQSFSVILKPGFAPLEQYQKKGNQGPWTDIYSLGTTIYHALTGDIPEDPMSRIDDDEEFSSNAYDIEPELWAVIQKATQLKVEDRYGDVFMLRNDLSRISYQPQPVIVPTADTSEKMPEFQTAVPFGMTQMGTTTAVQTVASSAPVQKKKFNFAEFCKKHGKIIAGVAAVLVLGIAAAIVIPNVLQTADKPTYTSGDYSYDNGYNDTSGSASEPNSSQDSTSSSQGGSSSSKQMDITELNTLASQIKNDLDTANTAYEAKVGGGVSREALFGYFKVSNDGKWSMTFDEFDTNEHLSYLFDYLKKTYPDMRDMSVCVYKTYNSSFDLVTCTQGADSVNSLSSLTQYIIDSIWVWDPSAFKYEIGTFEWEGTTAGVTEDGMLVGTYPVFGVKGSTSQNTTSEPEAPSDEKLFEIKDANELADDIRSRYSTKLETMSLNGSGRKTTTLELVRIEVDGNGYWSLTGLNPDYYETVSGQGHKWRWESSAKGIKADSGQSDNHTANMLRYLAECFPDVRNCAMCLGIKGMSCSFIALSYDITDADRLIEIVNEMDINHDGVGSTYIWDGKTPGLTKDGEVIGTDPTVKLK